MTDLPPHKHSHSTSTIALLMKGTSKMGSSYRKILNRFQIEDDATPEEVHLTVMNEIEIFITEHQLHHFQFITAVEAAHCLVISEKFLAYLDQHKMGPPAFRNDLTCVYEHSAVVTWGVMVGLIDEEHEVPAMEDIVYAQSIVDSRHLNQ